MKTSLENNLYEGLLLICLILGGLIAVEAYHADTHMHTHTQEQSK